MSATLRATGLSAGRGERTLFSGLDLTVAPGDVVGLVGANGAGKSSLLQLLAGHGYLPDADVAGTVSIAPPEATIGYLAQEPERTPGESILAFLARRTGVADAEATMTAAADGLAGESATDDYTPALEHWLALGGADLAERAEQIVAELGLAVGLDAVMTALSGGQAARVGLAAILLARYDVLLLDEPTNDLDHAGLDQLERFVADTRTALVLVSHDREFLARTVTRIVELDITQQQIGIYAGGYDVYLAEREIARRHAREAYDEYADTRSGLEDEFACNAIGWNRASATRGASEAQ